MLLLGVVNCSKRKPPLDGPGTGRDSCPIRPTSRPDRRMARIPPGSVGLAVGDRAVLFVEPGGPLGALPLTDRGERLR